MKSLFMNRDSARGDSAGGCTVSARSTMVVVFAVLSFCGCAQQMGGLAESEAAPIGQESSALNGCTGSDCVVHDLSTQAACTEVTEGPTQDGRWGAGLNTNIDQTIEGGDVVAYQILWGNGSWSGWYVTGVNDIDYKFNPGNGTMRRIWSYFYDHTHKYLICK
jgi:hypothetical protein